MSSVASSSTWTSFLKSIASYNGDLSSLTAPPFILSPTSLTEFSQFWGERADLLVAPNFIKPEEGESEDVAALHRMVAVTRWFISTLRSQYCTRNETMGSEKKPLNPFLGEVFVGRWPGDETTGETILLSEQVSHHPPVTAYSIMNEKNKTYLQGYNGIRASFSATTLNVKQYGHAILTYENLDENYLITVPPLHIEGLMVANPFVELDNKTYIQSSSGYLTVVEFSGRGYFSGKKHTFKARIYKNYQASTDKKNAIFTIHGQWHEISKISPKLSSFSTNMGDLIRSTSSLSLSSKANSTSELKKLGPDEEFFFDANAVQPHHLVVKDIKDQHELESRRAWLPVAEAIKKGDYDLINQEKSKLENAQRALRKQEEAEGREWERRWFDLSTLVNEELEIRLPKDLSDLDKTDLLPIDKVFIRLSDMGHLSINNVPSGTLVGDKDDLKAAPVVKHWRFNKEKYLNEKEIKI